MDPFTHEGTENRMRWDRHSHRFMEVWYSTLTHGPTGAGVWLRYTLTSPSPDLGDPYCELWGFVFDPEGKHSFAAKKRYPIDSLASSNGRDGGALLRISDAWLSESHLEGDLSDADGRTLDWSLDFTPASSTYQHIPQALRKRVAKRVSVVCSPNLSVPFTGTVSIDSHALSFSGEHGCQSHRWGRRHPQTWAWAHCSGFESGDALFEGVAARTRLGLIPSPTITLLYLENAGERLVFTEPKWALRARSRYEMPTWAFTAHNDTWRIAGAARSGIDRLVQVRYEDPDGSERFCANSEISDLAIEIFGKTLLGWKHAGSLTALRSAHLEFGREVPYRELPVAF
jgi:hypothetical protein